MAAISFSSKADFIPLSPARQVLDTASFVEEPVWGLATRYFKDLLYQKNPSLIFPENYCLYFSQQLFVLLFVQYKGVLDESNNAQIEVQGEKATLSLRYPRNHAYLELRRGEDKWIIDPTWKQLVADTLITSRSKERFLDTPLNAKLINDFPDILVQKFNEINDLFDSLSQESLSPRRVRSRYYANPDFPKGEYGDEDLEYMHIKFMNFLKNANNPEKLTWDESLTVDEWTADWKRFAELPFSQFSDLKGLFNSP